MPEGGLPGRSARGEAGLQQIAARGGLPVQHLAGAEHAGQRLQRLQALLTRQQTEFAASLVGQRLETLVEKPGRQARQAVGRSPWLQPVILDESAGRIGDIVRVRITRLGTNSLYGEAA